jgi:mercuric ion transport protein
MNSQRSLIGTGIFTSIAASLCCIPPVLAIVAGSTGFASTFSWIEPFRPYLVGSTILILGFAWYQKLKSNEEIDCNCEVDTKPKFIQTKMFLGIVTGFAILMLAFPYYSNVFFSKTDKQIILSEESNLQSVEFKIEGMTCQSCADHVDQEVFKIDGVISTRSSYDEENAIIEFDRSQTDLSEIKKAINSTGYHVIAEKLN